MPTPQSSSNTIVVRGGGMPIPPGGGVTLNNVPLEWLKKYSSPKPLFRPKPRKKAE